MPSGTNEHKHHKQEPTARLLVHCFIQMHSTVSINADLLSSKLMCKLLNGDSLLRSQSQSEGFFTSANYKLESFVVFLT